MFVFELIILFVCLTTAINGAHQTNINCPRFCRCDSYLQLNRAQCSSKRLISAEVDLPHELQILDLSYNDITTVDSKCFKSFPHLKYLNLSHNALQTIEWDAFSKLQRLIEIDLSYNRLEYLDEGLFTKNKYLRKINLEGNKLESLQNKRLLNNPSVSELSLKNSQINILLPLLFAGLTNLKHLDLSENFLNNFNLQDFQHLPLLEELNLNGNFIKCNDIIKSKLKQLEQRGVNVTLYQCASESIEKFSQNHEKFEKIVMSTQANDKETNNLSPWHLSLDLEELSMEESAEESQFSKEFLTSTKKDNEWFRFAPDEILCNQQNFVLCHQYRSCLRELNTAWHEQLKYKEQCSLYDIKFVFIMGIAIGVSAIIFILGCALCMKKCLEDKKRDLPVNSNTDLSSQPLARPTAQLPPQVRRLPRRRAARTPSSMVRYDGPVAENFLSRLFGLPARQQYYRSINQNTATLIRRLSRSNLFNNRLSQHFLDRQTSSDVGSPETPAQGFTEASAPRPETPPPSYRDVVIKNLSDGK